ncbi:hypothetical protein PV379_29470 [Streptomyces caniscabiei]|uniref:hypothetical protein n=1 Tax=Streptomyces caniscabiei TaxID=2746961 RepID=UPI0029ACD600|nr:hypothetical protein [Streptomyces caniscabiei]MDX2600365.1 hypothetical protein [Streptomyces caniscabiei]MDX2737055.1 hypothetical protein [Streptomyces caniscabiei]MDX2781403.1 hypothetical protein [Streptomyces caniscabiei]
MPYRIGRRPTSSSAVRQQLTDEVGGLLARMAFHQAWLQIWASALAGPYATLVATDSGMNLGA